MLAPVLCMVSAEPVATPDTSLPVDFKLPERPFLMMNKEEMVAAREKVRTQPWAREALRKLREDADKIVAAPTLFPKEESGWSMWYLCPKTGTRLVFDPKQPHDHYCPLCKTTYQGKQLDLAWLFFAQLQAADEQSRLASAWLLTGDAKYAQAMKRFFLDLAAKYPNYRLHDRSFKNFDDRADSTAGKATCQSIFECDLLIPLAFSYDTLAGSGVLSQGEEKQIEDGLWKPAMDFMRRIMRLHPSGGNWWIRHAAGATVLGVAFGDRELVDLGLNMPKCGLVPFLNGGEDGLHPYVNADGFNGELSPHYYLYSMRALDPVAIAAKRVGIDFYKMPAYKRLFDLPISIHLPNFHMPRLNDQAGLAMDSEWAGLYELASHWYPDLIYQRFLSAMYNAPSLGLTRGVLKTEDYGGVNCNALLYGPATLDSTPLDQNHSDFLRASGLAVLRSPLNDWTCLLKADRGMAGHAHPDALNLILFADGEDAFPGTGTTGYGHYTYLEWYRQTVAHNTVTLNTRSQHIVRDSNEMEFGLSGFGLAAAQSVANNVQGKVIENECPVRLRRTLAMTPHGIVDIFRAETDEARLAPLKTKPPVNLLDWTLHFFGNLAIDGKLEPGPDALIPQDRIEAPRKGQDFPHQGYKYITDLEQVTATSDTVHGRLTQPGGGKVDLWLAPSPSGAKVYKALGLGLETDLEKKMPMLLQRRSANDTAFAAVYAPFKDQPVVESVRFVKLSEDGKEAAIELTHADGTDLVLSLGKTGVFEADNATLEGTLGCRSSLAKGDVLLALVGTTWKDGDISLSLDASGAIVIEATASSVSIHNGADQPVAGKLQIKSLNIDKSFTLKPGETSRL